jgi:hypothetical protein
MRRALGTTGRRPHRRAVAVAGWEWSAWVAGGAAALALFLQWGYALDGRRGMALAGAALLAGAAGYAGMLRARHRRRHPPSFSPPLVPEASRRARRLARWLGHPAPWPPRARRLRRRGRALGS